MHAPVGREHVGVDWAGRDLRGFNLVECNLAGANLAQADLRAADLTGANLTGADLSGANLEGANLRKAHMPHAHLDRAVLSHADITEANLRHVHAKKVVGHDAVLTRAKLESADFSRSDMAGCKLYGAHVAHAQFQRTILRGAHMAGMRGYEKANWKNVDVRNIDAHGTYLARRFIDDQNYIHEFRTRSKTNEMVYWLWWLTSDCGRSVGRWALLTLFIVVVFAWAYTLGGINYGAHETWFSPFYYSVVTMTSLGYGDVVPTTPLGQAIAMTEVTLGYVMLGGLMSIFSTKMARRAD